MLSLSSIMKPVFGSDLSHSAGIAVVFGSIIAVIAIVVAIHSGIKSLIDKHEQKHWSTHFEKNRLAAPHEDYSVLRPVPVKENSNLLLVGYLPAGEQHIDIIGKIHVPKNNQGIAHAFFVNTKYGMSAPSNIGDLAEIASKKITCSSIDEAAHWAAEQHDERIQWEQGSQIINEEFNKFSPPLGND